MSKINFKRLAVFCVGIISLIVLIVYCGLIANPGFDYTYTYEVYSDLKTMSSLKDVECYLDNKYISYEIDRGKLTLPSCDSIVYYINPDNQTGYLSHSSLMNNLERLDERDLDLVSVKKETIDNVIIETIQLEENGLLYTKLENRYYILPALFYIIIIIANFILAVIILPTTIVEYIGIFFDWLKEKRDKKKTRKQGLELDVNKQTES